MLDDHPVTDLRIRPQELARRAALEQRKLREVINFCYTEKCYRNFILDYFGDPRHSRSCGTCGNCSNQSKRQSGNATAGPIAPRTELDRFILEHAPVGNDLNQALSEQSRIRRAQAESQFRTLEQPDTLSVSEQRKLTPEEILLVRKILACAARMKGRFGKSMLVSTLRGSRAKNLTEAGLDHLSTYGILAGMTKDELMIWVDALVLAGCLKIAPGNFPTVSLSAFGDDVMRERKSVELSVPEQAVGGASLRTRRPAARTGTKPAFTIDETYDLYSKGLSINEISLQRGLTEKTIEQHLAACILEGRAVELSRYVCATDLALIESAVAQHGSTRLRPLRDALPEHITYGMIRFAIAHLQRTDAISSNEQ